MRIQRAMLILAAGLLGSLITGGCWADDAIEVVKAQGDVAITQQDQPERKVFTRSVLPARHYLVTGPNGRAVVKVGDVGLIVVEKNSKIEIDKSGDYAGLFRHVTGMIYYALNTIQGSRRGVGVRTTTAVMGVRGTRFLVVDLPERKEVGMRKGLLSVTSPGEAYEIHRQEVEDEFEAFKKEASDAIAEEKRSFSEYKAKTQREFIEFKREFALGADRMASFDGNVVTERALSEESGKDMESLENYAAEWLKEVHD
ncbi:MAG: FecR family protein [Gammaproteobacteria bacterium]|nr:FecR family protein [Gammaproteobacteria bacterium]